MLNKNAILPCSSTQPFWVFQLLWQSFCILCFSVINIHSHCWLYQLECYLFTFIAISEIFHSLTSLCRSFPLSSSKYIKILYFACTLIFFRSYPIFTDFTSSFPTPWGTSFVKSFIYLCLLLRHLALRCICHSGTLIACCIRIFLCLPWDKNPSFLYLMFPEYLFAWTKKDLGRL